MHICMEQEYMTQLSNMDLDLYSCSGPVRIAKIARLVDVVSLLHLMLTLSMRTSWSRDCTPTAPLASPSQSATPPSSMSMRSDLSLSLSLSLKLYSMFTLDSWCLMFYFPCFFVSYEWNSWRAWLVSCMCTGLAFSAQVTMGCPYGGMHGQTTVCVPASVKRTTLTTHCF